MRAAGAHAAAPDQRCIDDGLHLHQQRVDPVLLSLRDGNLDRVAERQDLAPLTRLVRIEIPVRLPDALGEIGKSCFHRVTRYRLTGGR